MGGGEEWRALLLLLLLLGLPGGGSVVARRRPEDPRLWACGGWDRFVMHRGGRVEVLVWAVAPPLRAG